MKAFVQTDRSWFACFTFLVVITTLATTTSSQKREEVIRVDTELANFEVTVTDEAGRPITGLTAADFRVFENGVGRNVDFFQPLIGSDSRRPLVVVFALDISGSMTEAELNRLRSAMNAFLGRLSSENSYFALMTFSMNVRRLQDFTNVPNKVSDALRRIRREHGGLSTHAYDAIDDAVRLIDRRSPRQVRGRSPKRAIVVITDGFPVGDVVGPETVIERANAAEVSVYSLIMPSVSRLQSYRRPLFTPFEASGIVEKTGGFSYHARENELDQMLTTLAEKVSGSYAVAFYPDGVKGGAGEFREVKIETRQGFRIRQNRPGFWPNK
ncbi:MAG TPA: VWA domain-containing protein [Pyrinomonadaceae bacterium]|nr:VWA domain-containing protein [Pyrinomonadaceae bacterium]HMP64255.1 VWA domain-containing protein [Pyrinomonadaceae bacterium]